MKFFVVFASLLVVISALSEEEQWTEFKQDYSKVYKSLREDKLRFQVFKTNLQKIAEHNARYENGEESYFLGVNQFADLTGEEFEERYLGFQQPEFNFTGTFEVPEGFSAADSLDWRQKGAVLSVKNQGNCGSCWAFSAIAALEGQNALKHNIKVDLSEQELIDCGGGSQACKSGRMTTAFQYIQKNGISTLSSYPYSAVQRSCGKSTHPRASVKVTGFKNIASNEAALQAAVASVGPISVAIAGQPIQLYRGGVFDNIFCGKTLTHGVAAVGYGTENNKQYWLVKNSWGANWGENGYIKMSRNKNNQCGIASMTSYPVVA